MRRSLTILIMIGLFSALSGTLASYQMFCEIEGKVVSTPVFSNFIAFEFAVSSSRDIEDEILGAGWLDCHLLLGKRIKVVLEPEDAGEHDQISVGARLTLERYEVDVILEQSGDIVRSVKHVRTD